MHTARTSPSEPVAQCSQRSIQHHARAGPAHHTAYHLALCRCVTVSSASPARPFLLTVTTPRQPQRGIIAQSDILFGHLLQMQFMTAVQFYHHTHHPLLTFYTSVSHTSYICHTTQTKDKDTTILPDAKEKHYRPDAFSNCRKTACGAQ